MNKKLLINQTCSARVLSLDFTLAHVHVSHDRFILSGSESVLSSEPVKVQFFAAISDFLTLLTQLRVFLILKALQLSQSVLS